MSWLDTVAARLLGFDQLRRTYEHLRAPDQNGPLTDRLLEFMEVTWRAAPGDLEHVPRKGAAVVVANHPFGILEAAVLISVLQRVRPDVKVLANDLLSTIPELSDCIIPLNLQDGGPNVAATRQALRFLQHGGLLLVFPSGTVSHFQWRNGESSDPSWNPGVCRLIALAARSGTNCPVVPIFVPGSNSLLFHAAGIVHKNLRTALLAHELLNKKKATVELRVGTPVPSSRLLSLPTDAERIEYLRWRTYLLAKRPQFRAQTSASLNHRAPGAAIAGATPRQKLAEEVAGLRAENFLKRSGELEVYLAGAAQIPSILQEIGRLREVTFRRVGEGTGHAVDLDRFDQTYKHLFIWNARTEEIVGAYRLNGTDENDDLYTRTLFRYGSEFLDTLGPALELGRSFVRPEYQKSFAPLLLLWQGIGTYIARHPRYKMLFGPVSISNQYQPVSRELMLGFLNRWASSAQWTRLVQGRHAPPTPRPAAFPKNIDDLSDAVTDLESAAVGVPVLLRQYLKLGGRLLGFTVDPAFSNSLDGLIVVDLTKTEPKLLPRYLGKEESARFLAFHRRDSHHAFEKFSDCQLGIARGSGARAVANPVL